MKLNLFKCDCCKIKEYRDNNGKSFILYIDDEEKYLDLCIDCMYTLLCKTFANNNNEKNLKIYKAYSK